MHIEIRHENGHVTKVRLQPQEDTPFYRLVLAEQIKEAVPHIHDLNCDIFIYNQ